MPIISPTAISPHRIGGKLWRTYWTQQYDTIYNAMAVKPTGATMMEQSRMVKTLVDNGVWDELDCFYVFAGTSRADAYRNWVKNAHHCTDVHATPVTFTEYRGVKSTTSGVYLNSNYNPDTQGVKFVDQDQSFGAYSLTNNAVNAFDMGWHRNHLTIRYGNGLLYCRINSTSGKLIAFPRSNGFFAVTRNGAIGQIYIDGLHRDNHTNADNVMDNHTLSILSEDGAVTGRELAIVFMGGHLTKTLMYYLTNAIETYLDYLTIGVISNLFLPLDLLTEQICVIGDSIVGQYNVDTAVAIDNFIEFASSNSTATAGHTISQQKTAFLALSAPTLAALTLVCFHVGFNDLATKTSAAIIAELQDLADTIRANVGAGCKILGSVLLPAKETSAVAQAKVLAINEAIRGEGASPITGLDYRASEHYNILADPTTEYIRTEYKVDAKHPNNAGRYEIAKSWYNAINA